jgi:hypothetical protein
LSKINSDSFSRSKEYFIFLGLTIAVVTIVLTISSIHQDIFVSLIKNFVLISVSFIGYAILVRLAFWCVGSRAPFEKFFATNTYLAGPMLLVGCLMTLIAFGIFRSLDPFAYEALSRASGMEEREQIIASSQAPRTFLVSQSIWLILVFLWSCVSCGAYREANHVGRTRSLIAFVLAWTFAIPVFFLVALINFGVGAR